MLTAPAAMLTSVLGTKKGLSRRSLPSACSNRGRQQPLQVGLAKSSLPLG